MVGSVLLIILWVYRHGRSVYMPIAQKFSGGQTVASVEAQLLDPVWQRLRGELKSAGFATWPEDLLYVAFKQEGLLEVYGRDDSSAPWVRIKRYPFTAKSGRLGPKLREGDKQIPEGIYNTEYLNPNSSYHLSIKLNYPNEFDLEKANAEGRTEPGSDIFIHGKAVSIGCIALGDVAIEELFILTSRLSSGHQVIIAPWDFRVRPDYPVISEVTWERELYDALKTALQRVGGR